MAWLERGLDRVFLLRWLLVGLLIQTIFLAIALEFGFVSHFLDEYFTAAALLAGNGYAFDYYELFGEELRVGAFFPPGYTFNLYFLLRLFETNTAIFVQNIFLSLGVSALLFSLSRMAFGSLAARLTLILSILYPPFFIRITHGSPVYFKMFLMVLLIYWVFICWQRPKWSSYVVAGLTAGALALSMPDVLALVAMIAVAFGLRESPKQIRLAGPALFVITAFAVVLPWTLRNYLRFDHATLISTNGGYNLYMGHNADTRHEVHNPQIVDLDERLSGELRQADEWGRDQILFREALDYISSNPIQTAANVSWRAVLHWIFRPRLLRAAVFPLVVEGPRYDPLYIAYSYLYILSYVPVLALGGVGLWKSRDRMIDLLPLWLPFIYSTAIAALFIVQVKMRLIKAEPFLVVYAGYALAELLRKRAAVREHRSLSCNEQPMILASSKAKAAIKPTRRLLSR